MNVCYQIPMNASVVIYELEGGFPSKEEIFIRATGTHPVFVSEDSLCRSAGVLLEVGVTYRVTLLRKLNQKLRIYAYCNSNNSEVTVSSFSNVKIEKL